MSLSQRLRKRAMTSRTRAARAYWTRALVRNRAKRGVWDPRMLGGFPEPDKRLRRYIMRGIVRGLIVTSTTGGGHASTSWHYKKRAVDMGNRRPGTPAARARLVRFQRELAAKPAGLLEVFGPENGACVKNGRRIGLAEGTPLENLHDDHLHIAA